MLLSTKLEKKSSALFALSNIFCRNLKFLHGLCHINFKLEHYNAFLLKIKNINSPGESAKLESKLLNLMFDLITGCSQENSTHFSFKA